MKKYIPSCYENNESFMGFIIPHGDGNNCLNKNCVGLNCYVNCLYGNKDALGLYLISKNRKQKINKIKERICLK